jgi:excisionase family DNA binding protein
MKHAPNDRNPEAPYLMTPDEVSHVLNTSRRGVYDLIRAKHLVAVRVGRRIRVLQSDLHSYLERIRTEGVL